MIPKELWLGAAVGSGSATFYMLGKELYPYLMNLQNNFSKDPVGAAIIISFGVLATTFLTYYTAFATKALITSPLQKLYRLVK